MVRSSRSSARALLSALLITLASVAEGVTLDERLDGIHSLHATFEQKGGDAPVQTGEIWIDDRGRYRIDVLTPSVQNMVSDGKKTWHFDADLAQVTITQAVRNVGEVPVMLFVTDGADLDEHFRIADFDDETRVHYVLEPRAESSHFRSVALAFDDGVPTLITINDNLGNRIAITLTSVELNRRAPDERFSLPIPAGVDEIDDTATIPAASSAKETGDANRQR